LGLLTRGDWRLLKFNLYKDYNNRKNKKIIGGFLYSIGKIKQ